MAEIYGTKHKGRAIVCGAAPCVFEDVKIARALWPDAILLGVNNAAAMFPEIEHIWTQHGDHAQMFKEHAGRKIYVHARPRKFSNGGGLWLLPVPKEKWKFVDYKWPTLTWVAGSSGVAGALWAKHGMGFDEVILAGVPLSVDSLVYSDKYTSKPTKDGGTFADWNQVEHWAEILRDHKAKGKTEGIYSVSGETNKILGMPC